MTENPFDIIKAEEFNHGLDQLASLMHFGAGRARNLLNASNVFLDGSRGSGKSMYLRLLSIQAKTIYEKLASEGTAEPLPPHRPFVGVYMKLSPTAFGRHEKEDTKGFSSAFQEFFNVYAMECIVQTVLETARDGLCQLESENELPLQLCRVAGSSHANLRELWHALRFQRHALREALNHPPYSAGRQAQPEILWEFAEVLATTSTFHRQRVHLLVDEYDNLSQTQQRTLNAYLRKRDYPLTFKIACRKHRLVTHDLQNRPLNESGDFSRVRLDDDDLGLGGDFASYVENIANKRLANVGIDAGIRDFLGGAAKKPRPKGERRYGGFEQLVVLSSGIVRTFLELCRDIYANMPTRTSWPVDIGVQDKVVKEYAGSRWNSLSTDSSARPELQRLVEQVAQLFRRKSEAGSEKQIIRLEITDFHKATRFLRELLDSTLDYEAFIKPNRERLQKNKGIPSRGYLLHRLLCVHFRLEPESRWDFEISSANLEKLVTHPDGATEGILRRPTRRQRVTSKARGGPLLRPVCPILDTHCDPAQPEMGRGFLSCRLSQPGPMRDAIGLLKGAFADVEGDVEYRLLTAEDYPPRGDLSCKVCEAVARSSFVLVEFSRFSASVAMELGFCVARGVRTYVLFNREEQREVSGPFASIEYLPYSVTPEGARDLVQNRLVPFLEDGDVRRTIELGPRGDVGDGVSEEVFVALPDEEYSQQTILPAVREVLGERGMKAVTAGEGRALQDLHRAAVAIARCRFSLIDTTLGNPIRAMYLGMALGYGRQFGNLVNEARDDSTAMFANAKSKSVWKYRDRASVGACVRDFLERLEKE